MAWEGEREDEGRLLADLLGSAPMVVLRLDRGAVITLARGGGLASSGSPTDALVGRSALEIFADCPALLGCVKRALGGEANTSTVEAWGRCWDAYFEPDGEGARAIWMGSPPREQSLPDVQRELRFVDSVLDNVPNMIFVKDAQDLRFVRFNRAGEELLGRRREEMIGKNDYDFFPPAEADFFTAKDRAVLASGQLLDIPEEPIETRLKGKRYLRTKKIPILGENGEPLYLVGISEDITEWRALDQERRKVVDTLVDLDHLKAQLIANVSHELRTPLTIILLVTERLMRDGEARPGRLEDLAEIERSARALLVLVKDLLDASKLQAGRLRPDYANVDLARLVRLATGTLDSMARAIPVTFLVETPESLPAQVDPERVQHILTNLLSNAFKHTPAGGVVRCTLERAGEIARFTVDDTGPGIPRELRRRVFERFFQTPGERPGGTGLGLAIVKDFAELHGGRAFAGESPEGGARFVVELPLAAPATATVGGGPLDETPAPSSLIAAETTPEPADGEALDHPRGPDERPHVLVVEDHHEMRRLLVDALRRRYRVSTAVDGRDGLERALALAPDVILTDVMMPRMTGEELVRAVRAETSLAGLAIIVLTARDDEALRIQLLRGGAQDFVTKPFSPEELFARIDNLVAIKRTREILQRELESGRSDIELLARDLAARGHELRGAYADASIARRRAESSSQAKTEFLALVSHELRSPMTALRLRLDMLRRRPDLALPPHQAALVTRMTMAAERLFDIAQSLVDLVGVGTGAPSVTTSVQLGDIARAMLDSARAEANEKGLALRLKVDPGLPPLETDEHLVRVILGNLVGNAVKFTEQGEVAVTVSAADGAQRLLVEDTGPGIPATSRARIFEPFQHLEPLSHKHTRGTGVGLAIVRRAVDALGGTIELSSRTGGGTSFCVSIPTRGAAS